LTDRAEGAARQLDHALARIIRFALGGLSRAAPQRSHPQTHFARFASKNSIVHCKKTNGLVCASLCLRFHCLLA
jgi:hypothetical protein